MRKLMIVAGGALLISSSAAVADVLGVGANVSYWDSELTGKAGKNLLSNSGRTSCAAA